MPGENESVLSEEEQISAALEVESSKIAADTMAQPLVGTPAPVSEADAEAAAAALLAKAAEGAEAASGGEGETPDQIAARGAAEAEAARVAAAAAEKTPEQIAAEEAAAETETARVAAEEAAAEAAEAAKGPPKRVHLPTHLDDGERHLIQAAASLARAQKISFAEAFAKVSPQPEAAREESAGQEEKVDPIKAKREEPTKVTADLDEMYANRELDSPQKRALQKQERALEKEIENLESAREEQNHERVQTAQEKFDTDWVASEKVVKAAFPDHFNKDDSPLNKAVVAELQEISKNPNHPLAGKNGNADLPEILFAKHALRMGIAPVKPAAAAPAPGSRVLPAPGTKVIAATVINAATKAHDITTRLAQAAADGDLEAMADINEEQLTGKKPTHGRNALSLDR